uniref:Glutaredoxin domain-containing protein n=1 Tax=Panagrolaimus sp. JU765 TaxID=591449 RepID=A0AC34QJP4_9BILA
MWRTIFGIFIFYLLILMGNSLAALSTSTSESKDSMKKPKFDVELLLTASQSDDFDLPNPSVLYPSSPILPEDDLPLLSGETPEDEDGVVPEAENEPPAISRMPQNFYRRRFLPRRPWGPMNGNNYPMNGYNRWGPPPPYEMIRRGYGTNNNGGGGGNYGPGPGLENLYNGGYGLPDYNNGENGCGNFRCNQNIPFGNNNGGTGCGPMGCGMGNQGMRRPNFPPFMGTNYERGGMNGPIQSIMGGNNMGWGSNNNIGGGNDNGDDMNGNEMMGGSDGGPPNGGVGIYMANRGYSYAGYIERQVRSTTIMMYTLVGCIPCQRAKHLLAVHYSDVKSHFLELPGAEDWQRQLEADLHHLTGATTFPYIFVCGNFIGGSSDLFRLHQTGQLRRMVNSCARHKVSAKTVVF